VRKADWYNFGTGFDRLSYERVTHPASPQAALSAAVNESAQEQRMAEENAPAEIEEEEELEDFESGEEEDAELYTVVSGRGSRSTPGSVLHAGEDDSPLHKIDFMHDVPLRLSVEIGQTQLSVRDILALNVGKVVEFTKVVGEPMDITVSGRLMARGEIVVVNERYGVRISEVTRPDETETAASMSNN
jgi:flagellar motor switch protein FliN/FliY